MNAHAHDEQEVEFSLDAAGLASFEKSGTLSAAGGAGGLRVKVREKGDADDGAAGDGAAGKLKLKVKGNLADAKDGKLKVKARVADLHAAHAQIEKRLTASALSGQWGDAEKHLGKVHKQLTGLLAAHAQAKAADAAADAAKVAAAQPAAAQPAAVAPPPRPVKPAERAAHEANQAAAKSGKDGGKDGGGSVGKDGLVQKEIVDSSGRTSKRWVRPEQDAAQPRTKKDADLPAGRQPANDPRAAAPLPAAGGDQGGSPGKGGKGDGGEGKGEGKGKGGKSITVPTTEQQANAVLGYKVQSGPDLSAPSLTTRAGVAPVDHERQTQAVQAVQQAQTRGQGDGKGDGKSGDGKDGLVAGVAKALGRAVTPGEQSLVGPETPGILSVRADGSLAKQTPDGTWTVPDRFAQPVFTPRPPGAPGVGGAPGGPTPTPGPRPVKIDESKIGGKSVYVPTDPASGKRLGWGYADRRTAELAGQAAAQGIDRTRLEYDPKKKGWSLQERQPDGSMKETRSYPKEQEAAAEHHLRTRLEADLSAAGVRLGSPPEATPVGEHSVGETRVAGHRLFHATDSAGLPVGELYRSRDTASLAARSLDRGLVLSRLRHDGDSWKVEKFDGQGWKAVASYPPGRAAAAEQKLRGLLKGDLERAATRGARPGAVPPAAASDEDKKGMLAQAGKRAGPWARAEPGMSPTLMGHADSLLSRSFARLAQRLGSGNARAAVASGFVQATHGQSSGGKSSGGKSSPATRSPGQPSGGQSSGGLSAHGKSLDSGSSEGGGWAGALGGLAGLLGMRGMGSAGPSARKGKKDKKARREAGERAPSMRTGGGAGRSAGGGKGGGKGKGGGSGSRKGWESAKLISTAKFLQKMQLGQMDSTGHGNTAAGEGSSWRSWNGSGSASPGSAGFAAEGFGDAVVFAGPDETPLSRPQLRALGRHFMESLRGGLTQAVLTRPHLLESHEAHRETSWLPSGFAAFNEHFTLTHRVHQPEGAIPQDEAVGIVRGLEAILPDILLRYSRVEEIELYATAAQTQARADELIGDDVRGVKGFYARSRHLMCCSLEGDVHNFYHELAHSLDHLLSEADWKAVGREFGEDRPENFARGFAALCMALRRSARAAQTFARQYPALAAFAYRYDVLQAAHFDETPLAASSSGLVDALHAALAHLDERVGHAALSYRQALLDARRLGETASARFADELAGRAARFADELAGVAGDDPASRALLDGFCRTTDECGHRFADAVAALHEPFDDAVFALDVRGEDARDEADALLSRGVQELRDCAAALSARLDDARRDVLVGLLASLGRGVIRLHRDDRAARAYAVDMARSASHFGGPEGLRSARAANRHLRRTRSDWRLLPDDDGASPGAPGAYGAYSGYGDHDERLRDLHRRREALATGVGFATLTPSGNSWPWMNQVRDERGRWGSGGGAGDNPKADTKADTKADAGVGDPATRARIERAILAEPRRQDLPPRSQAAIPPVPRDPAGTSAWLRDVMDHPYVREATRLVDEARKMGATTGNLYWDPEAAAGKGDFTPQRKELHERLADSVLVPAAATAPGETPKVCFVLGGPGSGKTSQGRPAARAAMGLPASRVTTLDPDDCKMLLPEYRGWNAALLHDESGELFDRILSAAVADRHNVVFDTTGSNAQFMKGMIDRFAAQGYEIHLVHTHVSPELSCQRAASRFVQDAFEKRHDPAAVGRYVPVDWILHAVDGHPDRNFHELSRDPRVSSYTSYDATDLAHPTIRVSHAREGTPPHLRGSIPPAPPATPAQAA